MSEIEEIHKQIDEIEREINSGNRSPAEVDGLTTQLISLRLACGRVRAETQHEADISQMIKIDERMQKLQAEADKLPQFNSRRCDIDKELLQLKIQRQRARQGW